MSLFILPSIGAAGVYTLAAPFNTALTPKVSYTCLSIRTLHDIIAEGNDPFALYYNLNGLSETVYQSDLASNVSIVGLQSGSGDWVYVPSSYISAYPDGNGVPYTAMMIGVSLGAIPDSIDLGPLQTEIQNIVLSVLGVNAATNAVAVSKTQLVDNATDASVEAIRRSRITLNLSTAAQIATLTNQLALANTQIASLQAFIVANKANLTAQTSPSSHTL